MSSFPQTRIGALTASRLVIGTNWFLGYSHDTAAKDQYIRDHVMNRRAIADILTAFFREGVNTIIGVASLEPLTEAVREAQDNTGVEAVVCSIPTLPVTPRTPAEGLDLGETERIIEQEAKAGARVCMPHQQTTDALLDRCTREIRHMAPVCRLIRDHGMEPGLSTHIPEAIIYADESGLDVETYVSIYNLQGFLMQLEVDWTNRIIHAAKKPALTIKPFAAGQVRPFQGLNFAWNTLRPIDMVAVGTMSPGEALEVVEMSREILDRQPSTLPLQETRSKGHAKSTPA